MNFWHSSEQLNNRLGEYTNYIILFQEILMVVQISSAVCQLKLPKINLHFSQTERDVKSLDRQEFKTLSIFQNAVLDRGEQFLMRIVD